MTHIETNNSWDAHSRCLFQTEVFTMGVSRGPLHWDNKDVTVSEQVKWTIHTEQHHVLKSLCSLWFIFYSEEVKVFYLLLASVCQPVGLS